MEYNEIFTKLIAKIGNNENPSIEVNELMTKTNELEAKKDDLEREINQLKEANESLKESNIKLLLTKGFVKNSENHEVSETEEKPKFKLTDYIEMG